MVNDEPDFEERVYVFLDYVGAVVSGVVFGVGAGLLLGLFFDSLILVVVVGIVGTAAAIPLAIGFHRALTREEESGWRGT